jgi:hypothetical protein
MGESVFVNMAADLLAKDIDNMILKQNSISYARYQEWKKQYTFDAMLGLNYGESFCKHFDINDYRIFHETNWQACDAVIRREWLARS